MLTDEMRQELDAITVQQISEMHYNTFYGAFSIAEAEVEDVSAEVFDEVQAELTDEDLKVLDAAGVSSELAAITSLNAILFTATQKLCVSLIRPDAPGEITESLAHQFGYGLHEVAELMFVGGRFSGQVEKVMNAFGGDVDAVARAERARQSGGAEA